jgi:hypothetical protein
MRKQTYALLVAIFMATFGWTCTKSHDPSGLGESQTAIEEKASTNMGSRPDGEILDDFQDALDASPTTTISDLFSPTYQASTEYADLSSASVSILTGAGILDSVKYHLNTVNNADPRLIIAAKLINEMVIFPPGDGVESDPPWLNCLVSAGIGISLGTLRTVTEGGTIASIGQAIRHMGVKWFAGTVGKIAAKYVTGIGLAWTVASFSICLIRAYADPEESEEYDIIANPQLDDQVNGIPASFFNTNRLYFNHHKEAILQYLIDNGFASVEMQLEYVYTSQGDPTCECTHYTAQYFSQLGTATNEEE